MAVMYPKNIELYNPTKSELIVYKTLERQLPDTFIVFYSVQWVDERRGKKIESECDFLIFSEQYGFLTCEVKGGRGYKKENDCFVLIENDGERILKRSPMEQSEESSRYFYGLYSKEYNDRFTGTYGSISVFPFYEVNDPVLLDHRAKDVVFDIKDMEELGNKIRKAFAFYKKNNNMSLFPRSQRIKFKDMINKKIATKAAAGAVLEQKEYELNNVNRIQDNFIAFLKNYKKTFITGGAGTGKTWIAYKFAKLASLENKKVLITCMNTQLIYMFKSLLQTYNNVDIFPFNELLEKDGIDKSAFQCSDLILSGYDNLRINKYNVIIVDEAQDFDQNQAMIVSLHLYDKNSEFRVFYDFTQNILDKDFKDGFDISCPPFVLNENLRNTASIYDWAKAKTNLGKDVITNQIIGPTPEEFTFNKIFDAHKYIENEIINMVNNERININSIVLILDHDYYPSFENSQIGRWNCVNKFNTNDSEIRICLVEEFKGLESNIVFYIHGIQTPENYNYVAYTRAKYYLFNIVMKI